MKQKTLALYLKDGKIVELILSGQDEQDLNEAYDDFFDSIETGKRIFYEINENMRLKIGDNIVSPKFVVLSDIIAFS